MEIAYSVAELRVRGKFDERKLEKVLKVLRRKIIEEDPNAPTYYSQDTILIFSLFGSALLGAILLACNVKGRWDKWVIIGCGITFSFFIFVLATSFGVRESWIVAFHGGGVIILATLFWEKYIGNDVQHKNRAIWLPLLLCIPFGYLFMYFLRNYVQL